MRRLYTTSITITTSITVHSSGGRSVPDLERNTSYLPEGLPDFGAWLTLDLAARPSLPDQLQALGKCSPQICY